MIASIVVFLGDCILLDAILIVWLRRLSEYGHPQLTKDTYTVNDATDANTVGRVIRGFFYYHLGRQYVAQF